MTGKGSLGDVEAAEEHLARAAAILAELPGSIDRKVERELEFTRGMVDLQMGRFDDAESKLGRAEELARAIVADDDTADGRADIIATQRQVARVAYQRGEFERADELRRELVEASRALAEQSDLPRVQRGVPTALRDAAESREQAGDHQGALELYRRGVEFSEGTSAAATFRCSRPRSAHPRVGRGRRGRWRGCGARRRPRR